MKRHLLTATVGGLLAIIATLPVRAQSSSDWPTYGMNSLRTGYNPHETILGPTTVKNLGEVWAFNPGGYEVSIDPKVDPTNANMQGQPIVAHSVLVDGKLHDLVLIGDNNGYFFALDANSANETGTVLWHRSLGTRLVPVCNKVVGIQATGAITRAANGMPSAVYIGLTQEVHALRLTDGKELRGWPVTIPDLSSTHTDGDMHDGANIVGGKLYIGTSGHCDRTPYYGRVVKISTSTAKIQDVWYPLTGTSTPPLSSAGYGGGVWGWGGVSIDPGAGTGGVYVGTGNHTGRGGPTQQAYAEEIVNLSRSLTTVASAGPKIPLGDYDYGSTPVVFQPTECPTKLLAALNKTGHLVLEAIGADGMLTVLESRKITTGFNGNVAWDPVDQLLFVSTPQDGPTPYKIGLHALRIDPSCGHHPLSLAWQTTNYSDGKEFTGHLSSPTVTNGLVWFGIGMPNRVLAVATASGPGYSAGKIMWESPLLRCPPSVGPPTVVNGRVYVSCIGIDSRLYAFALK